MKEILPNVYAVEVPKGTGYFAIHGSRLYYGQSGGIDLPEGNYQLIQPKVVSQYTEDDANLWYMAIL